MSFTPWVWALAASSLAAQVVPRPCDPRLVTDRLGPNGYQRRADTYCEGIYARPVSGTTSFHVVSLLTAVRPATTASIQWSAQSSAGDVQIAVRSLRPLLNYRLDALAGREQAAFTWNPRVLNNLKLAARELGVLVFEPLDVEGAAETLLHPSALELPGDAATAQSGLRLTLLPDEDLLDLTLTVRTLAATPKILTTKSFKGTRILRGRPFPVELESPPTPGRYAIAIAASAGAGARPVSRTSYFQWP